MAKARTVPRQIKRWIEAQLQRGVKSVNTDEATIDGSRVYVQPEEPEDADDGDVWIDTSE